MTIIKVRICPQCGQAFTLTAAGQELMFSHLIAVHEMDADAADTQMDQAAIAEQVEALPTPLPRCH